MQPPRIPWLSGLFLIFVATPLQAEPSKDGAKTAPRVAVTEVDGGLRIDLNGERFTEYRYGDDILTFPVFYPVIGPGGLPMTRDYPFKENEGEDKDHPHHRSIWFTHSIINGVNFWAVNRVRDREPGRTVHKGFKNIESGDESGGFIAMSEYVAPEGNVVCTDERAVRIPAVSSPSDTRFLDIALTIRASHGPVVFGNQKDGGMAIRVAPSLQTVRQKGAEGGIKPTGRVINSEGHLNEAAWGKRAKWVDINGLVRDRPAGVAIFDHPSNPHHPTWWHARTYGLCSANVFGRATFEKLEDPASAEFRIENGQSATFRWRFCFHQGDEKQAGVEGLYEVFAKE